MVRSLVALSLAVLSVGGMAPAAAQAKSTQAPSLVGTWTGTVTIADGAQVVDVQYAFTKDGGKLTGTAAATGQGEGPVTGISTEGNKVKWTVSLPQGEFVHEAQFMQDGSIEGTITMQGTPVATFSVKKKA